MSTGTHSIHGHKHLWKKTSLKTFMKRIARMFMEVIVSMFVKTIARTFVKLIALLKRLWKLSWKLLQACSWKLLWERSWNWLWECSWKLIARKFVKTIARMCEDDFERFLSRKCSWNTHLCGSYLVFQQLQCTTILTLSKLPNVWCVCVCVKRIHRFYKDWRL